MASNLRHRQGAESEDAGAGAAQEACTDTGPSLFRRALTPGADFTTARALSPGGPRGARASFCAGRHVLHAARTRRFRAHAARRGLPPLRVRVCLCAFACACACA